MSIPLLSIANLQITVDSRVVVDDLSARINQGEVVALVGANGSGKSSLAMTLIGDSRFNVLDKSKIEFAGKDLLAMSPDERSRAGVFVAWQNPVSIPGVSVFSLCKVIYEARGNKISELVAFKNKLEDLAIQVGLPKEYITRNVNEGFSGGEKKRLELLELLLLSPKLAILDEVDSGIDTSGVKLLLKIIRDMKKMGTSFILITHSKKLIEDKVVDTTWEMKNGRLSAGI